MRTESGSAWLLARVPGLQVTGLRGALLSNHIEAERIHFDIGKRLKSLTITAFVADGLRWQWRPNRDAWLGLQARVLSANTVVAMLGPPTDKNPPASLHVPFWIQADALQVQTLQVGDLPAMTQFSARVTVGAREGAALQVDGAAFNWERAHITGVAELGTQTPFALRMGAQATALLAPLAAEPAWVADISTTGQLLEFEIKAAVQGQDGLVGQRGTLRTDLQATVRPFAAWPLAALSARAKGLNLAAFSLGLPTTALSGHVEVQSRALDAPISANIHLDNPMAGRWDEQQLPMRRLDVVMQGSLQDRNHLVISSFDVALGPASQDAGRWRGKGDWRGHELVLDTQVQDLRPQHIDSRAARMTLSGPLKWAIHGLPAPGASAQQTIPQTAQTAQTTTPVTPETPTSKAAIATPLTLDLRGSLEGRTEKSPQTIQLTFDTTLSARRVELRQLRAIAGAATAQLQAVAERLPSAGWTVSSEGALNNFDPLPWWPGTEGSAWRQGTHRLFADWQVTLQLLDTALEKGWVHMAQTVVGSGNVRVHDSVLAGLPLQLDVTLAHSPTQKPHPSSLKAALQLAGNQLLVEAKADPAGPGTTDRLHADFKVTNLGALAPLTRLFSELSEWTPRAGQITATLEGQGRWPDMRSTGQATIEALRAGELQMGNAQTQWRLDTASDQPLSLQFEVSRLALGALAVEQGKLDLQGTWAKHELRMSAAMPIKPPGWTESILGVRAPSGTRAQLTAQGAWEPSDKGGGRWSGRVQTLSAGALDSASEREKSAPWFETANVGAELHFSSQGALLEMNLEPGRMTLADGATLQWDAVRVDNRAERPHFQVRAEVSAFAAAPIVARLQPGVGWSGDLRVAATLNVRATQSFDADLVFERRDGDLYIEDIAGRQAMGLSEFRLAMSAHDGQWSFTQQLAGSSLGELQGVQRLRTPANQRWPAANTPLEGGFQAKVSNLGIWSSWVPPGWRLSGELTTNAVLGGQFGAPQYTGQVRGSNIGVRNLLLGLDLTGGDVAVALKGTTAQIEQFTLHGGDGTLTVAGKAELGSSPQLKLQLQAQRFRVLGRVDRQLVTTGQAVLDLQADRVVMEGTIRVDEGRFDIRSSDAPSLDDDVSIRSKAPVVERPEPEPSRAPRRDTRLNIQVDLGDKLRVRGRGLDTALAGQLKVSTPGGRLAVTGLVQAVGGTYAAYGQKLEIDRGILSFSGVPDNPGLDILALRPNIDTKVGVAISGNFVTPRVRLFSDPEMSDTDKLSWLVLGRASDGLGRADTALLQRAAVALLSGEGEAPTDAFLRSIGIDELSLRQSEGDVRETVITLGKQLSRRWYLGYERGVNATSGTFQLIYRIAQRFTLRAQSGHDNSLDVIWVWRVGEKAPPLSASPGTAGTAGTAGSASSGAAEVKR